MHLLRFLSENNLVHRVATHTAQRPPDEVHEDAKSHLVVAVPKCVGPTHDPTASAESSVSLSVLSSHHDIFSYKVHML